MLVCVCVCVCVCVRVCVCVCVCGQYAGGLKFSRVKSKNVYEGRGLKDEEYTQLKTLLSKDSLGITLFLVLAVHSLCV